MTSTANVHPRERIPQAVAAFVLLAALFLGGRPKGIGDAVVHAIALGALGLAAWRWPVARRSRLQQTFFALLVAAISIVVLQLIPLPADVFARLPQRAQILAQLRVAGLDPGWLPMTLDWWGTVRATLALLSFLAMWMLCSTLPHAQRVQLLQLAVATAVPLALLGFVQASGKLDTTGATGVFANRNHFATLMAMLVPFAIAAARQAQQRRTIDHGLVWYGAATALLLAAAMSFSRAGSLLAGLSAVTAMMWLGSRNRHDSRWRASFAVAIAVLAIGYFASDRLLARFHSDLGTDLRWQYFQNAWDVFRSYLPWGSGLGSFRFVYAQAEPMSSLGEFTFALYAHDEWLQVGIEAGLPGLILMAGFVGLVVVLTIRLLRMSAQADPWAKAAAIATLVPLLHSLVDYPLRTLACSTLLALGLSILTDPASTSSAASRIR